MRSSPLLLGVLLFSGCAVTPPKPAPTLTFELGASRTTYRDYRGAEVGVCEAEPRWLADDLTNANSVLSRFLERTDPAQAADWTAEQRSVAIDGRELLPPFVENHVATLQALQRCGIANWQVLPMLRKRGLELSAQVTERLPEISLVLEYVDAQVVLHEWQRDFPQRRQHAEDTVCNPRSGAEIYYAEEGANGEQRWFFCDGARVQRMPGGEPDFTAPSRSRGRVRSTTYVKAAREFPQADIVVAPSLPAMPAALGNATASE